MSAIHVSNPSAKDTDVASVGQMEIYLTYTSSANSAHSNVRFEFESKDKQI